MSCDYLIRDLLPHDGNMVLIDELLVVDQQSATAVVVITNHSLFLDAQNQVPAWIGIEYMAQTIAAQAGYVKLMNREAVNVGYLLGTRRYESQVTHYAIGNRLTIKINKLYQEDNGLGAFDCEIYRDDQCLNKAVITVFQAPN